MNKTIKKCSVCAISVAVYIDDNDPICVHCLEWFERMNRKKEAQRFLRDFRASLDMLLIDCTMARQLEQEKFLNETERKIIGSLANIGFVLIKGREYVNRLI